MPDQFIIIDEPTVTDKRMDTEELTVSGSVVQRERIMIAGALALELAVVTNSDPGSSDYALVVRNLPSGTQDIRGDAAHDATVGANPLTVGGRANANEPSAVADGDATHAWFDTLGRLITVAGHPSPEAPVVVNATASGDTEVIAAPGAGVRLYIRRVVLNNGANSVRLVHLQEGGSAVNRGGGDVADRGGGMILDYGERGWQLALNTALDVNLDSSGDIWVSVLDYYIAA